MQDINTLDRQQVAWTPSDEVTKRSRLKQFMDRVGVSDWEQLYNFSINDVEFFTAEVLDFLEISFDPPYDKLLDTTDGIQFPKWCVGGGLNITEVCLDRWQGDNTGKQAALIWEGEEGGTVTLTYRELLSEVNNCVDK